MKDKKVKSGISEVNPQDILAESLKGIHLVDAGAGTGKTHTIIRRYSKLLQSGVKPEDILLITFTNVAASQMKEDVIAKIDMPGISMTELLEAPVMTFHALCTRLLKAGGSDAPLLMGINEMLSPNFNVITDSVFEGELFRRFITTFNLRNSRKYSQILLALEGDNSAVLGIIKKICSAGIFPDKKGWVEDGLSRLKGSCEKFMEMTSDMNIPEGKKTAAYKCLDSSGDVKYNFDSDKFFSDKCVNEDMLGEIFNDSTRDILIEFLRDVYIEYVRFLIKRNQLNFEFLVMLAYIKLLRDDGFRQSSQYKFIMVDEFQDTDIIQFKLLLLLCDCSDGSANLAVVGDWRQGIFGFRNTTIKNITEFEKNIFDHLTSINKDKARIELTSEGNEIRKIEFEYNYRSSQEILDFSRHALFVKATDSEEYDFSYENRHFVNTLRARRNIGNQTEIGFFVSELKEEESETDMIISKIKDLVSNPDYMIKEFDKEGNVISERGVRYSDVAVLSRTRAFCIKFQKDALKAEIPVSYDGGLEVFASKQAIILLAWLKFVLNKDDSTAVTTILENEGYSYNSIEAIVQKKVSLPESITGFREELLKKKNNMIYLAEAINGRYCFTDEFAKSIAQTISSWISTELLSLGSLVAIMENSLFQELNIELNKTYDTVTCKTIHSSKGLEFPVVFVSNVNKSAFPDSRNSSGKITFNENAGVRLKKVYGDVNGYKGVYDNWQTNFVNCICREHNYSESRRLLYVALTRAKQYLFITAFNPSNFFTGMAEASGIPVSNGFVFEGQFNYQSNNKVETEDLIQPIPKEELPESMSVKRYVRNFYESEEYINSVGQYYRGLEFGREIHVAAYRHAKGIQVSDDSKAVKRIQEFIDSLGAQKLEAELDFSYPKDGKLIRGTIDLVAHFPDHILIVDYKTDKDLDKKASYEEQVKLYKEAAGKIFPGKEAKGMLYFTALDKRIEV